MTSAFNWRAIFWFLSIVSGLSLLSFVLFFRDTFRRERSLNYQNAIKQRRRAGATSRVDERQSAINDKSTIGIEKNGLKKDDVEPQKENSLALADVNPMKPLGQVLRRKNNIYVLFSSGTVLFFFYS